MRDEWDALLAASRQDSPYLEHHRLHAWWDLFGEDKELRIIACRDGEGGLAGVLPNFATRVGRRLGANARRMMADMNVGSVGLTGFARSDVEGEVFGAICESLLSRPRDWDVLDYFLVDGGSPFVACLREAAPVRVIDGAAFAQRIVLPRDWESYVGTLTRTARRHLNNSLNKSKRAGDEFEVVEDPAELPDAMEDFWRLHEQRMGLKLGSEFDNDPRFKRFVERTAAELLGQGRLRHAFLVRDGRRSAVLHQFVHGNTVYALKSGFVADGKAGADYLRPLIAHEIRHAIETGREAFDMMLGEDEYKRNWGVNEVTPYAQVKVYGRSARGRMRLGHDAIAETAYRRRAEREGQAAPA